MIEAWNDVKKVARQEILLTKSANKKLKRWVYRSYFSFKLFGKSLASKGRSTKNFCHV